MRWEGSVDAVWSAAGMSLRYSAAVRGSEGSSRGAVERRKCRKAFWDPVGDHRRKGVNDLG